jgi:hypothetical protein
MICGQGIASPFEDHYAFRIIFSLIGIQLGNVHEHSQNS